MKTLQRLVGKCVSFSLAVPAAQLFTRQMNAAIAGGRLTPRRLIAIKGELREEISHWLFLEDWHTPLPWRDERHVRVSIATDASATGWGAIFLTPHRENCSTLESMLLWTIRLLSRLGTTREAEAWSSIWH